MTVYAAATDVALSIDLLDALGGQIVPDTDDHAYEIYDENDVLVASDVVALTSLDSKIEIVVAAASNVVASRRGARTVRFSIVSGGSTHQVEAMYVLENAAQLIAVPSNSAQTFAAATMRALDMPSLDNWEIASERDRKMALIEAYDRLAKIRLLPFRSFDPAPESARAWQLARGEFRLNELSPDDWALLPTPFKDAVARAQLLEADAVLDADDTYARREDGLLSETVGESSRMWRVGRPTGAPATPRARRELAAYIDGTVRISR